MCGGFVIHAVFFLFATGGAVVCFVCCLTSRGRSLVLLLWSCSVACLLARVARLLTSSWVVVCWELTDRVQRLRMAHNLCFQELQCPPSREGWGDGGDFIVKVSGVPYWLRLIVGALLTWLWMEPQWRCKVWVMASCERSFWAVMQGSGCKKALNLIIL